MSLKSSLSVSWVRVYLAVVGTVLLLDLALSLNDTCLTGTHHKKSPSPETTMKECVLYSNSSCCHGNFTEKLVSPVKKVDNTHWNVCQQLSEGCEVFMKKIECFYQCSPHTAHWMNPSYTAGFLHVPLCVSFCDSWLDACKDDLTCAKNWLTDFKFDSDGNHCQHDCVPFGKMYSNGTDLCQSMWGTSFVVSSSDCHCLQLDSRDEMVLPYILHQNDSSSSLSPNQEGPCHHAPMSLD
ncbi:hypothetical protein MATL_G00026020 [Megalops atlanticus]|uniref:Folate receptor-like domain-containing protein n=1 Tax=Megalops atlanticus TaxID=7932 RepID=A0A9D3QC01_MEGAT|nr:hypothetical protein MATL_G00026020 [Megalops atlanticus]